MMLWRDEGEAGGVVREMGNADGNWMIACYEYIMVLWYLILSFYVMVIVID